jgi:hypothetical protein
MNDDVMQTMLAAWAARNLPARLDVVATAKLLGFAEHDIQILMAVGKLTPLGDPAPNAPKWFAARDSPFGRRQRLAAQVNQRDFEILATQT